MHNYSENYVDGNWALLIFMPAFLLGLDPLSSQVHARMSLMSIQDFDQPENYDGILCPVGAFW